jgi:nucleoside-triphosphatase
MNTLLLTGRPGIGKTTVIRRVAEALRGERIAGFYAEERHSRGAAPAFKSSRSTGAPGRWPVSTSARRSASANTAST